jgi:hypothetical protein
VNNKSRKILEERQKKTTGETNQEATKAPVSEKKESVKKGERQPPRTAASGAASLLN